MHEKNSMQTRILWQGEIVQGGNWQGGNCGKGNCGKGEIVHIIWIMVKVVVSVNIAQARLTVIASIALSAMVSDLRNAELLVSLHQVSLS